MAKQPAAKPTAAKPARKTAQAKKAQKKSAKAQSPQKRAQKSAAAAKKVPGKAPARQASAGVACCAVEAVAASARLAGYGVSPDQVLDLYFAVTGDPGAGMTIQRALEAAAEHGVGGVRPVSFAPALAFSDGTLAGLVLRAGSHAVTLEGRGAWSWGSWWPVPRGFFRAVEEAWDVKWPGRARGED